MEHYLKYYNADHSDRTHDSSLDCTFCGKLFPIFYDDWRGIHYRCCYQCATCANDDYVWFSECSNLTPAKLAEGGNLGNRAYRYDNTDRAGLFDRDNDVDKKPPGWYVALEITHNYFGKVYFDNFWDTSKCRWVRKPVFLRKCGTRTASIGTRSARR